jgi:large subunit ribosomal protein L32
MAVPKKKTSKAKSRTRRSSSWRLIVSGASTCPTCNGPKRAHYVCPNCGYYKGKPAVEVEA